MALTKTQKQERAERDAAWEAERARVNALGELFSVLPECPATNALRLAMRDRIIDLYDANKFEEGDAILEFLPNKFARELLDWYFPDEDTAQATPPPTGEHEGSQQGEVPGGTQQPSGADGQCSVEAHTEIIGLAKDLVALWQSPKIQGLPRAERNATIESVRNRLITAVTE